mmetsp:Transcript_47939/g.147926  ORF Transcript_47939/g.147926 Transcript_47939/m.147926 type:complete len:561 (-) Transcript_47939:76-1758(-)
MVLHLGGVLPLAQVQHALRRTLGRQEVLAGLRVLVRGRHALDAGVEGVHARALVLVLALVHVAGRGDLPAHGLDRDLGGVAAAVEVVLLVLREHGRTAQRGRLEEVGDAAVLPAELLDHDGIRLVVTLLGERRRGLHGSAGHGHGGQVGADRDALHHHLVLREGAGLVGADVGHAVEDLEGAELADNALLGGHLADRDGHGDGDDGDKGLREDRDGDGRAVDDGRLGHVETVGGEDDDDKKNADSEDGVHELLHLQLQRRLGAAAVLSETSRDLAHLSVEPSSDGDATAAAGHDNRVTESLVHAVAESAVALGVIDHVDLLRNGHNLAGQQGLVDLQVGALKQTHVDGDVGALLEHDDVTDDDLVDGDDVGLAVTDDDGVTLGHGLQALQRCRRVPLLVHADDADEDDDEDADAERSPVLEVAGDDRDEGQDHRDAVHEVVEDDLDKARAGARGDDVVSKALAADRDVLGLDAVRQVWKHGQVLHGLNRERVPRRFLLVDRAPLEVRGVDRRRLAGTALAFLAVERLALVERLSGSHRRGSVVGYGTYLVCARAGTSHRV